MENIHNSSGNLLRRYLHGATVDERLQYWQYADATGGLTRQLSYAANHQGSIIGTVDLISANGHTAGTVTKLTYDAYGVPGEGEDGQPFRYTGRRYDPETGLYYYRARYYSHDLGRFLQTDPIGYEDNMNLYAYTNNDPVNNTDPTGENAIITVTGNDVKIELVIKYNGEGVNAVVAQTFKAGIEKQWSGQFGKYNVQTVVRPPSPSDKASDINNITVNKGSGRSSVTMYRNIQTNEKLAGNTGTWHSSDSGWVAGHEAGHLMGVGDQYKDVEGPNGNVSKPNKGYETNVMGAHGQTGVTEAQITDVINDPNNRTTKATGTHRITGRIHSQNLKKCGKTRC